MLEVFSFLCCCLVTKSHPALRDPMDCSPPGSSVHGISQARMLSELTFPSPEGSSRSRCWTCLSCTCRWILYCWATWEARVIRAPNKIKKECYLLWSCLVDSRRMLLFMVEQAFLLMGEVWSICDEDTQSTGEENKETKEQRNFFNVFSHFSCLAIECEFYFTPRMVGWHH